jgi:hypothetical protein
MKSFSLMNIQPAVKNADPRLFKKLQMRGALSGKFEIDPQVGLFQ